MKKFVALLMAMLMVMMIGVAAFAEGEIPNPDITPVTEGENTKAADAPEYSIPKTYSGAAVYPTETLQFEVTPEDDDYPALTVGDNNTLAIAGGTTSEYTLAVNVPAASVYGAAGRYHYTVVEKTPTDPSQAAVYDTETFNVDVYVSYEDGELVRKAIIYSGTDTEGGNAEKTAKEDKFENTYSVADLTVSKTISGNLADPKRDFVITITLTSENTVANDITLTVNDGEKASVEGTTTKGWKSNIITLTAKGGGSVTIGNIPTGVTYTVVESDATTHIASTAQLANVNDPTAYYVEGEVGTDDKPAGEIATGTNSVTITNTKEITIPTGITLESVPYVLIMALVLFGMVKMTARKREQF